MGFNGLPPTLVRESAGQWTRARIVFGQACAYCQSDHGTLTRDHVIPQSFLPKGWRNYHNIVPACIGCNMAKREFPVRWFMRQMGYDWHYFLEGLCSLYENISLERLDFIEQDYCPIEDFQRRYRGLTLEVAA